MLYRVMTACSLVFIAACGDSKGGGRDENTPRDSGMGDGGSQPDAMEPKPVLSLDPQKTAEEVFERALRTFALGSRKYRRSSATQKQSSATTTASC